MQRAVLFSDVVLLRRLQPVLWILQGVSPVKNKMITLDDDALLTAQQIGNFSAWVRKQLHYYEKHGDLLAEVEYQKGIVSRMWNAVQSECEVKPGQSRQAWLHHAEERSRGDE